MPARYFYFTFSLHRRELQKAFQVWKEVAPLNFREVGYNEAEVDINIQFGARDHRDGYPFDGRGTSVSLPLST